ncbi:uncharacterized protein C8R40DRAFT_1074420 [Lentinula edodes]|uniref:uncharacterized protein n=1 Tax=Lentinula edodes TaxID=5353 RepID=UPI001E8E6227|nr:uncharacterized protein C8R40DRAFT_1074420 [Lentinula edodes]KAH7868932.1 hypothetical protein C8R40DRAFT_1074420 [Lentinula edodes]
MQSRLSGMSLYLKICFIVILSVAYVVALPVSGSGLVPRADQALAGPANQNHNLGDLHIPWTVQISVLYPQKKSLQVDTIRHYKKHIVDHIKYHISENSDITICYDVSHLPQIPSLLPPGTSYDGDVSLKFTWSGPNHMFESRGEITTNSKATAVKVKISFPADDEGIRIRKYGVPENAEGWSKADDREDVRNALCCCSKDHATAGNSLELVASSCT